jgi:hypothetical protein
LAVISEATEGNVRFLVAAHLQVSAENLLSRLGGNGRILENGGLSQFKILETSLPGITLPEAEVRFAEAVRSVVSGI